MATGTQIHGHSRLDSLETVVASNEENGGEIFELHDVLSDGQEDPGTTALRRLDWDSFMEALDEREKAVIDAALLSPESSGSAIQPSRPSSGTWLKLWLTSWALRY
jgi:hypothetical protein